MKTNISDVVIVGSGSAGLFAALTIAENHPEKIVTVLSEKPLGGVCASAWAQGGIAAVVQKGDTTDRHIADTLKAGAGTSDAGVVSALVEEAPKYVQILEKYGVQFLRDDNGDYALNREACHTSPRVLRSKSADGFGAELMRALVDVVKTIPNIQYVSDVTAERLLRQDSPTMGAVQGIVARDLKTNEQYAFLSHAVLMATGGAGGLYEVTTNPLHAVGRGVVIAARAGAVLADMEFVQFHPTAMDLQLDPAPLATEALRGAGATLLNARGERFMQSYHPMAELAPRDVVSRGIFAQMQKGQRVYLDCRHVDTAHFSALLSATATAGLNPKQDLIPVRPAVHYHMGGIHTDLNGRASITGLWAAGECASTGLHGANRLASNSLMEAIVMGHRAGLDIGRFVSDIMEKPHVKSTSIEKTYVAKEPIPARDVLRGWMSRDVGVIRHADDLKSAIVHMRRLLDVYETKDTKTADMVVMGLMIAYAALKRTESRGGHSRSDFPVEKQDLQKRSFMTLKQMYVELNGLLHEPAQKKVYIK